MSGASQSQKANLLFKARNNVVDVVEYTPFTDAANKYALQSFIFGDRIFRESIPLNLEQIRYTISGTTSYGVKALHQACLKNNLTPSWSETVPRQSNAVPTPYNNFPSAVISNGSFTGDLTSTSNNTLNFYFRVQLTPAKRPVSVTNDRRTWYLPDPTDTSVSNTLDSEISFLRGTPPFNYDTGDNKTYEMVLEKKVGSSYVSIAYYGDNNLFYLMDNESGFIQIFGEDSEVEAATGASSQSGLTPLYLSFVRYEGPRGAGGGNSVIGTDASFQNLYAEDASFQNIYVEENITFDNSIIGPDASFQNLYAEDASFQNVYVAGDMTIDGSIIGEDAVFDHISCNTLDCTSDASFQNVYVADSARLPEDTLVNPFHKKISSGSYNNNEPFFNPEYVETKQIKTIAVDPSLNPISTTDWITIARCTELFNTNKQGRLDCRADAMIKISQPVSGRHETITFIATFKYSEGLSINVLQHDWYSGPNIAALRIAYDDSPAPSGGTSKESTYNGAVLQMQMSNNLRGGKFAAILSIQIMNNEDYPGWSQFTDSSGNYYNTQRPNLTSFNIPVAVPDNNPKSQRIDVATNKPYNLNDNFVLPDLAWNPSSGNANQITTNPARFTRQVNIQGELTCDADTSVGGKLTVGGDADIGGDASVGGDLTVDGNTTLGDATNDLTTVKGDLVVDVDARVKNNLTVDVDATVKNNLTVDGNATVRKNLTVDVNASVGGDLTVDGNTTLGDATNDLTTVKGDLVVDVDARVKNNLTVDVDASVGGDLTVDGDARVKNNLTVDVDASVGGDLTVDGDARVKNNLTVDVDASVGGDLTVDGDARVKNNLTVDVDARVGGDLTVDGNTTLGDTTSDLTTVKGDLVVDVDASVTGNLIVDGTTTLNDTVTIDTTNINFNGDSNNANATDVNIKDGNLKIENTNNTSKIVGIELRGPGGTGNNKTMIQQQNGNLFAIDCRNSSNSVNASGSGVYSVSLKGRDCLVSSDVDTRIQAKDDVWIQTGKHADPSNTGTNADIYIQGGRHIVIQGGNGGNFANTGSTPDHTASGKANVILGDGSSANRRWIEAYEPFKVFEQESATIKSAFDNITLPTNSAGNRSNVTGDGVLAYSRTAGQEGLITRVNKLDINLARQTYKLGFTAALQARTHASNPNNTTTNSKVTYHMSHYAPAHFTSMTLTNYGSQRTITFQKSPHTLLVTGYTFHPYFSYANNPSVTNGPATISFEIWVATHTSSYYSDWVTNTSWFSTNFISGAGGTGSIVGNSELFHDPSAANPGTACCVRLSNNVRTITHRTSAFGIWHSQNNSSSAAPVTVKLSTPFYIPKNQAYNVFFVERLVSPSPSNATVNWKGTNSLGYAHWQGSQQAGVPIAVDLHVVELNTI